MSSTESLKTPNKRKPEEEGTSSETKKNKKGGGTDPVMEVSDPKPDEHGGEVTTQEDRMGAVGGTDTGSTGTRAFLYSKLTSKNCIIVYKRTWNFYSLPYAKQVIPWAPNSDLGQGTFRNVLTTSMAAFPTDIPCFYMSPAEYSLLPTESRCIKTYNKIAVVHASTAFQSNESAVANVSVSNQLLLDYCKGAVLKGNGSVATYTTATADPMVPTEAASWGTVAHVTELSNTLWTGVAPTPPGTAGTWTQLPAYLALHMQGTFQSNVSYGWFDTDQLYGSCNAITNYNTDFMQHTQHYTNALLNNQRSWGIPDAYFPSANTHVWPIKNRGPVIETGSVAGSDLNPITNVATNTARIATPKANQYYKSLSNPTFRKVGMKEEHAEHYAPWLYVGLREIPAVSVGDLQYQDGTVFFQYECEMHVHMNFDSRTSLLASKSYADVIWDVPPYATNLTTRDPIRTSGRYGQLPSLYGPAPTVQRDPEIGVDMEFL